LKRIWISYKETITHLNHQLWISVVSDISEESTFCKEWFEFFPLESDVSDKSLDMVIGTTEDIILLDDSFPFLICLSSSSLVSCVLISVDEVDSFNNEDSIPGDRTAL
jgi:hypothetical protein